MAGYFDDGCVCVWLGIIEGYMIIKLNSVIPAAHDSFHRETLVRVCPFSWPKADPTLTRARTIWRSPRWTAVYTDSLNITEKKNRQQTG